MVLLWHGDSIPVVSDYPAKLGALIKAGQPLSVEVYNRAIGSIGFTLAVSGVTLVQDAVNSVDPIIRTRTPSRRVVLGIDAGTNDIWLNSKTAAQTYAAFETYLAARIAAGLPASDIYVATMLPRSHGNAGIAAAFEVIRQDYVALIVAGAATYGYNLVRRDLDPDIGDFGDEQNATYYLDMIHLNGMAGGDRMAELAYDVVYP